MDVLKPEIQQYINENIGVDISKLALKKNPFLEIAWIEVLNQIAAKTKAKDKLPTWFQTSNIIYPAKISVEQTSSEKTAAYKSKLVSGENLIDLTGGFGIDDFYFLKKINHVIHCEINPELSEIARHNFEVLKAVNIKCISGDSTKILKSLNQQFDWIYIDPSRRHDAKGKVFMLADCLPNVPELLDLYFSYTNNILIKTAPILDITAGISELKNIKSIHIVAVENEVKELVWEIHRNYIGKIDIKTINISKDKAEQFDFSIDENVLSSKISFAKKFIYEPNSAIMKSGGFDEVGIHFGLDKLHRHSHLYTSSEVIDFPGRVFEVQKIFSYGKKEMKSYLENGKFNITTRNFPETVENIRKKWKIKDGGNVYCFFTTDHNNNKIVLICTKITVQ